MDLLSASDRRRIEAEQAILDLVSIVKELVENSLDALASSVDVLFTDCGRGAVTVKDDGHGMSSAVLARALVPHSTTKIQTHADLTSGKLNTVGFRGEALSALSLLSEQVVITSQDQECGRRRITSQGGTLTDIEELQSISKKSGTTVHVVKPLSRADIRANVMDKQATRLYADALAYLQEIAFVRSADVRVSVRHVNTDSPDDVKVVFQTPGNIQDPRIALGQLWNIPDVADRLIELNILSERWQLKGFIANPTKPLLTGKSARLGYGATQQMAALSSSSQVQTQGGRQGRTLLKGKVCLFSLERKPINFPASLLKMIDTLFRRHTSHHCACCYLDLHYDDKDAVLDFNMSVDKRTVVLPHVLEVERRLREKLEELLPEVAGVTDILPNSSKRRRGLPSDSNTSSQEHIDSSLSDYGTAEVKIETPDESSQDQPAPKRYKVSSFTSAPPPLPPPRRPMNMLQSVGSQYRMHSYFPCHTASNLGNDTYRSTRRIESESRVVEPDASEGPAAAEIESEEVLSKSEADENVQVATSKGAAESFTGGPEVNPEADKPVPSESPKAAAKSSNRISHPVSIESERSERSESVADPPTRLNETSMMEILGDGKNAADPLIGEELKRNRTGPGRPPESNVRVIGPAASQEYTRMKEEDSPAGTFSRSQPVESNVFVRREEDLVVRCDPKIALAQFMARRKGQSRDVVKEEDAECIGGKAIFGRMRLVGGFDSSFIVTVVVRGDFRDLYLVDQHAADEKHRFESLNKQLVVATQPLMAPLRLHFAPRQRSIALAYAENILRYNGFIVKETDQNDLYLLSTAVTQGVAFNQKDLEQLVEILAEENPESLATCGLKSESGVWGFGRQGTLPRPPRLWNILAMR